jgi:predicted RNA binding protein YcfA (HicA-like mRNA interferase family)
MNLSAKYLIKILENYGFEFRRAKGSHQVFYRSDDNRTVIVPYHGGKDMSA